MDANYQVIGIVQMQINGTWSEQAAMVNVYAVDRSHAKDSAIKLYESMARQQDSMALVRWYTPNMVRVYSI